MKWSFPLARIAGVTIYIHTTFVFLLVYVLWPDGEFNFGTMLVSLFLLLLLCVCVILHELGHSIVARRCGIPVEKIVLWPFGGTAHLARQPDTPRDDLFISAAGPLVNVILAGVALIMLILIGVTAGADASFWGSSLAEFSFPNLMLWLFLINLFLVLFNLIPAYPLDGGHILRSILLMLTSRAQASKIMTIVGWSFAGLIGLFGLILLDAFVIIIALVIGLTARHAISDDQLGSSDESQPPKSASVSATPTTDQSQVSASAGASNRERYKTGPLDSSDLEAVAPPTVAYPGGGVQGATDRPHATARQTSVAGRGRINLFVILNFVLAGLALIGLGLLSMVMIYGIFFSGDPTDEIVLTVIGMFFVGLLPIGFVFMLLLLSAVGLLGRKVWGYYTYIVVAVFMALTIVGIPYAVPALIYGLKPEFRANFFHKQQQSPIT